MGKLIWILLEIYRSLEQQKNFANQSRIGKVIAMFTVAQFVDSQCIIILPCVEKLVKYIIGFSCNIIWQGATCIM